MAALNQTSVPYVSTGQLPDRERVVTLVEETKSRFETNDEGENSRVYPALAAANPDLFGIAIANVDGDLHATGDAEHPFTIMSVSKPFVLALVCSEIGPGEVRKRIGFNATGLAFNAEAAVYIKDGLTNPMVNPGAIATTSLVSGATAGARWARIRYFLSAFAGRDLEVDEETFDSASATNFINRHLAESMEVRGRLEMAADDAVDLYTRQCCLEVTATDLAIMGATLANGGLNALTGEHVVEAGICRCVLAMMATAGLYETSGDWLFDVGLPGKSGIGGGMLTVSPGKGALGTFAPRLDGAGNSVKGQLVAQFLSRELGLDIFTSQPRRTRAGELF